MPQAVQGIQRQWTTKHFMDM